MPGILVLVSCNFGQPKTTIMKRMILAAIAIAAFTSCTHESTIGTTNGTGTVTPVTTTGTWKITTFVHNGNNEKSLFDSYTFEFPATGTIAAKISGTTENGTFVQKVDDGEQKVDITFNAAPLTRLNDDWHIITTTATELDLQGDDNTQQLHFSKQ